MDKRAKIFWLLVLLLLSLNLPVSQAQQATNGSTVTAVGAIGMTVSDLARSVDFYTRVLSFQKVSEAELHGEAYDRLQGLFALRMRVVRLRLGDEEIELTQYLTPKGRPAPIDSRSNDRWFQHIAIIVGDMDRAYHRLREHQVEHVSPEPQRLPDWNPNAGGIRAFYFKDPDGHPLEILQFPAGKGDPKWHRGGRRLFLGIDHTAIVVNNTETSLHFYRDRLGLKVAGKSENHGPEQERLNAVFGARLRITTLRAAGGPGVELLEYLSPRDGRPMPIDVRANDLMHWQTRLVARHVEDDFWEIQGFSPWRVSSGLVSLAKDELGFRKAIVFRDPDGHAIQIVEP